MLKNYFKTAWRNIVSSKAHSAINVLGLASGMAVALLIGLWVRHEYSYDKFLPEPVALYFLQNWLQKYDYRVVIGPWVFIIAALLSIAITIITVSFQAIKAAVANPVKSLRTE